MEFLHTRNRRIENESGEEVILRGYGIGNWLNQEGFLFGSAEFGAQFHQFERAKALDRGRTIYPVIEELCGKQYAKEFFRVWQHDYFTKEDIQAIAKLGFNSVRLPFAARCFLREEPGYYYEEEMFLYLDQIIAWCEQNNLYVILDMHAAVGGQSAVGCDDGIDNMPHLFYDEESYERTIVLWEKLATRYANVAAVAGYELLNEPLALPGTDSYLQNLRAFYDETIQRIRRIDQKHMLFLQGHRFASRADIFDRNMDPGFNNWVYTAHLYESLPDLGVLGPLLAVSEELNVPIWMGETGGSKEWMTVCYEMLYENHIGVNIWCHKGEEHADAAMLCTYSMPKDWDTIRNYVNYGEKKPSFEKAISIFNELLEHIKFENCLLHQDLVDAIFRRGNVLVPAIGYDMLPGAGRSFQGSYPYCAFCGYRREDRMHLVYEKGYTPLESPAFSFCAVKRPPKYGDWLHLQLMLHRGDFACYHIRAIKTELQLVIRAYSNSSGILSASYQDKTIKIIVPAGEEMCDFTVGLLSCGEDAQVKICSIQGDIVIERLQFSRIL